MPFGVYILTYPGDFHLSTALVRSIQTLSPDIPIMIIPGEGFDRDDHPFDVPIMPQPEGFWRHIGYMDRDFWSFQGPFETFLYLDADTLVVKSLDALASRITGQQENFIYVQPWMSDEDWSAIIRDPAHAQHDAFCRVVENDLGGDALQKFDPTHDFYAHCPFNAGLFASRRFAIGESDVASLNAAERRFYRDSLGRDRWSWSSRELFRLWDQGRLNYLVRKLSIPVYPIAPEVICVLGATATPIPARDQDRKSCPFHVIHWTGALTPSPSFFCRGPLFRLYALVWSTKTSGYVEPGYGRLAECAGYSLWRRLTECSFALGARLDWSWRDLKRLATLGFGVLKLLLSGQARRRRDRLRQRALAYEALLRHQERLPPSA